MRAPYVAGAALVGAILFLGASGRADEYLQPLLDAEVLIQNQVQIQVRSRLTTESQVQTQAESKLAAESQAQSKLAAESQVHAELASHAASESGASHQAEGFPILRSLCPSCKEPSTWWRSFQTNRSVSVLVAYLALCAITVGLMFYSITKDRARARGGKLQYPEVEAWKQGLARWLWLGWATSWISQWGNAEDFDPTKLVHGELPMQDPEDECAPCSKKFEGLWNEEVRKVGLEKASLLRVIVRFASYKRLFFMGLWETVYEAAIYLGPPLAIEQVISFVKWLYVQRELGHHIPQNSLAEPTLWTIVAFTGLPLTIAVCSTAITMISARMGIRICGALSSAVFLKGQRLPVSPEEELPQKPVSQKTAARLRMAGTATSKLDWMPVPTTFNLVQLVAQDVMVNISLFPMALIKILVKVPMFIACLSMLCRRLGWAVVFPAGVFFVNFAGVVLVGSLQGYYTMVFCNLAGKRLEYFQQIMFGMRFIKSFGGEHVMQEILERFRSSEVKTLHGFYLTTCLMYFMMLQFTRLYFLASLGGYALLYGSVESVNIIIMVPLLNSVQGAFSAMLTLVPTLASTSPSCTRVEHFLKLPEAPRKSLAVAGAETSPPWVSLWPAPARGSTVPPVLAVQGSFGWQPDSAAALKDINISIPHGQLVAVLGHVGAGKSTLLLAMLGELHPLLGSRITVPAKIAYSSQLPHIFEGTLRDNIMQGDFVHEERYQEALRATHLPSDLEVLPGGDEALVGSRGISLSGGQKARVSMARAAYSIDTEVVLIDDPFGAVDFCTAQHLMEQLLLGPILRERTRVVVCQPDSERLSKFDWVIILADGRVAVQGPPEKVMRTAGYKSLLCSQQAVESRDGPKASGTGTGTGASAGGSPGLSPAAAPAGADSRSSPNKAGVREAFTLREEAFQGRTSWVVMHYFARLGGTLSILSCIVLYLVKNVLDISADVVLARWTTHGIHHEAGLSGARTSNAPRHYLSRFAFWWCLSTVAWFCCWVGGQWWTIGISKGCHAAVVKSLMRAPIDKFYDKTPVGRIMNRMSNDMMHVDTKVFLRICSTIGLAWSVSVPLIYVHLMMPLWFTVLAVPYYWLMISILRLYWKTTVPLQYLAQVCKSSVDGELAEVQSSNTSVRAYNKASHRLRVFQLALCDMVSAKFLGETVLKRWLNNRIFVLGGIFVTCLALVIVWVPGATLDVGTANLCLVLVFSIIVSIESMIHNGASAQYQIIAMNRLHEYTTLPQESPEELSTDGPYLSHLVRIPRSELVALEKQEVLGRIQITREGGSQLDVLMQQIPYRPAFKAACGKSLAQIAPECEDMKKMHSWHRVVCVNGSRRSAREMAEELCSGTSEMVTLQIQSGWLADGIKVEIQDLRAGYSDRPRDVLQDVTLTVPRRCKVGLIGTTGSGKSTLLLCVLRILEPRSGRVLLEGVDTQRLGLRTLRSAIGMVPQDHVLLQGPLRYNIDPFSHYSDEHVWEALRYVQLADYVKSCEGGLNFQVTAEGANLSYGQRQLMSLARNILRQPTLLLLDEATSAIDPHTQELVQSTMKTAFPDSTMIVVAHRLEAVLGVDMVAVMDEGRIVEKGPVRELSRFRGGRFAGMLAAKQGDLAEPWASSAAEPAKQPPPLQLPPPSQPLGAPAPPPQPTEEPNPEPAPMLLEPEALEELALEGSAAETAAVAAEGAEAPQADRGRADARDAAADVQGATAAAAEVLPTDAGPVEAQLSAESDAGVLAVASPAAKLLVADGGPMDAPLLEESAAELPAAAATTELHVADRGRVDAPHLSESATEIPPVAAVATEPHAPDGGRADAQLSVNLAVEVPTVVAEATAEPIADDGPATARCLADTASEIPAAEVAATEAPAVDGVPADSR